MIPWLYADWNPSQYYYACWPDYYVLNKLRMNKSKDFFKCLEDGRQNGAVAVEGKDEDIPKAPAERLRSLSQYFLPLKKSNNECSKPHFSEFPELEQGLLVLVKDFHKPRLVGVTEVFCWVTQNRMKMVSLETAIKEPKRQFPLNISYFYVQLGVSEIFMKSR